MFAYGLPLVGLLALAALGSAAGIADGAVALLALLGLAVGLAVAGRWSQGLPPGRVAPMKGPWRG